MLDLVNSPVTSISTIEERIEYKLPQVNQTQARPELGLTMAAGLRTLLRQDADVIMVGDVAEAETAALATTAALTEHLVLAGLQAASATSALARLHDLKVAPAQVAAAVKAVVALRLIRTLGPAKVAYKMKSDELKSLGKLVSLDRVLARLKEEKVVSAKATWADIPFYKPKSEKAAGAYVGQTALAEVLTITPTIKELLLKGASARALEIQAKQEGFVTLLEEGIFQAARGVTTIEEVLRAVSK
jgi:type IV pilus assembly protein PilB